MTLTKAFTFYGDPSKNGDGAAQKFNLWYLGNKNSYEIINYRYYICNANLDAINVLVKQEIPDDQD